MNKIQIYVYISDYLFIVTVSTTFNLSTSHIKENFWARSKFGLGLKVKGGV